MALNGFGYTASTNWNLVNTSVSAFNASTQSDQIFFALASLDLTTWTQVYVGSLSIAAAATTTIDLTSFTNLVQEAVVFAHVKSIYVQPSGAAIKYGPGASNGLVWFFDDATATITVQDGGFSGFSDVAATTPANSTVVDSSHKTLKFVNQTALTTAWNSGTSYVIGNKVSKSSNNYTALLNGTNHDPLTSPTYWVLADVCTCDVMVLGSVT